ncbi:hypothetical protein MNQ98_12665 [Paenibacillus sp. N3/727]|uniref:hypothetical protein n=1 Tax=Paenibacillus sp. N3/727 TaxID=2925845 RepID=UPI001F53AFFC|nr:hypothetical protein [Paenibacillus sp. N3/727]UNK20804.1 hypothetical protein MNQ98_12665 [Paenibacillus sp. N3/727]
MFSTNFKEGLFDLSIARNPSEVLIGWSKLDNEEAEKSVVVALDDYKKSAYFPGVLDLVRSNDSHLIPYFKSENLYFMDSELLNDMMLSGNQPFEFKLDYSIMLDTNYASYIDNFIKGNWNSIPNEALLTIDVLLKNDFRYDYWFYMIENYKNSFGSEESKGITNKKIKFYENLVNLELFKNIDTMKYKLTRQIEYMMTKDEALISADQIFNGVFNSNNGKEMMNTFIPIHKNMVLLLLGIFQIKFADKSNISTKLQKLFEYSHKVIGVYFERELMIAHKYFCKAENVKILAGINKGMKTDNLLKIIENIAWDFTVPRIMEFFLTRIGEGRFFIPFFLSNDYKLRELLKLFAVKGIVYNKREGFFLPISDENIYDYYTRYDVDVKQYFTFEAIEERKGVYQSNCENEFIIVKEEYQKLLNILG